MPRTCSNQTKKKQERGVFDTACPGKYQPWISVRECSGGRGRRHLVADRDGQGRVLHFMSDLEKETYHMLKKNPAVKYILEQYPLELSMTLMLCERMNIKHPRHPKNGELVIMTSDFLFMIEKPEKKEIRWIALAVKPASELRKQRVCEKLLIEKTYWEERFVSWYLVTEEELCSYER